MQLDFRTRSACAMDDRRLPAALLTGLLLLPVAGYAVLLGDLVAESRIGEPFRGYVPVTAAAGDQLASGCFSVAVPEQATDDSRHYLTASRITLEGEDSGRRVRIDGLRPATEPFLKIYLRADCGPERASREYTVLIDPPGAPAAISPGTRVAAVVSPPTAAVPAPDSAPGAGTEWVVREGDTASAIARAIYPASRGMRQRLVANIVSRNPQAFAEGDADRMLAGATIVIPDLRQLAALAPRDEAGEEIAPRDRPRKPEKPAAGPAKEKAAVVAVPVAREPAGRPSAKKAAAKPDIAPRPPAPAEPKARVQPADFRLRLSGTDLSVSLIGKLTDEQRKFLRERQFLLDADDQMASFLALRHRVSELEKQLESMRLKMSPTVAAASPPVPQVVAPRPQPLPAPATVPFESDAWRLAKYGLTLYLLPFSQIVMALLALFFVLRYYNSIKERLAAQGLLRRGTRSKRRTVVVEPEKDAPPVTEFDKKVVIAAAAPPAPAVPEPALDTVDAILEEAQLYVIHGHPDHAIKLLEDQIRHNRGEVRIWMLLFVILRSQGMKVEFEKLAKRFHGAIRDDELWENIQTLGNELDPENELYMNDRIRAQRAMAASPGALDFTLDPAPGESASRPGGLDLDLGRAHEAPAPSAADIGFDAVGKPGKGAPGEPR